MLWLQKKLFLKAPRTPKMMMNSEIFEIQFFLSNCSTKCLMCLDQCFRLVLYDQGFRLVVIRPFLGPLIRFYCRKMKNSSFFQKWYSKSVENYFRFCSFWEPHWSRFRLKFFFKPSTCIIYVFRTSLWSHSFATK